MEKPSPVPLLEPLTFAELSVSGWLRSRLELQEAGLGGHIEELWPDLGPSSAWLGGSGEAWERGPYYLDGLAPLAFLLGDPAVAARAHKWAEAMLASARPDGSFGPLSNPDWWPRAVALKALLSWREATGDGRFLELMLGYCRYQASRLEAEPLSGWAAARGSENALAALELWRLTREPFLLGLAAKCLEQELDWDSVFRAFPYPKKTGAYLPRLPFRAAKAAAFALAALKSRNAPVDASPGARPRAARPGAAEVAKASSKRVFRHYHFTHNVNYAMAVKRPAVAFALERARGATGPELEAKRLAAAASADRAIDQAMRAHGLGLGIWSGDEHFSGRSPTQGIELCGIVELMHSLECLVRFSGEARFADRLEELAFNALPAAFTEDMRGHQYLQQVNQVEATRARRPWYDNGPESTVFGLAPEFGCCAANFHQGFPKLAKSLWLAADGGGLALCVYAPSSAKPRAAAGALSLTLTTDYPVDGRATILVEGPAGAEAEFPLWLRVPAWSAGMTASVNRSAPRELGPAGAFALVERGGPWRAGDSVELSLPLPLRIERRDAGAVSIHRGPLLFALGLAESWTSLRGTPPYDYREARPLSAWNYALVLDPEDPGASIEARAAGRPDLLFKRDEPPMSLNARGRLLRSWRRRGGSAGPVPASPLDPASGRLGPEEGLALVPYACARLRIAEFPWVGRSGS